VLSGHLAPTGVKDTHSRTRASQEPIDHHRERITGDGKRSSPETLKRLVSSVYGCRSLLSLQKLRCRSFDDLEPEISGFAFEIVNLQFAVLAFVKLRSSVDECDAVAQHAVDQSS
jgi:hypothetical protein